MHITDQRVKLDDPRSVRSGRLRRAQFDMSNATRPGKLDVAIVAIDSTNGRDVPDPD
jgi:hypothetical protein